ncbi:GTPase-activating protein GYP7 [Ceratocystis fimbriata CBS 114723]|uniref:GTPase-activating protein GYP7 n=1 Tax=Ceratocystis fimbriata CBS 114723 TaxID=1035309 RepID=A0A2C5X414_9PEZI|nr:GTPase-activating protein GYP7 [Ceratocystis fimbriata CBS 114723]
MASSSTKIAPDSPTASFYAMSDEEEGYSTITHTKSATGVKLLFCKSKVYMHPTPVARDNISGYITVLQQKGSATTVSESALADGDSVAKPLSSDLFLAWFPETSLGEDAGLYSKVDMAEGEGPWNKPSLVPPPPTVTENHNLQGHHAFAVPLSSIYSLTVRPPSLGWWYGSIIINSRSGDSFPALFFHDNECQSTIQQKKRRTKETFEVFGANGQMFWGGDEVLRWLKMYVRVERSGPEPNIYLIDASDEDIRNFGKAMEAKQSEREAAKSGNHSSNAQDPFVKFVKEASWNIMERFSRVTTYTRRAAQDVLDNPRMPPQMRRLVQNPDVQTLQEEYDSAHIYLARWAMGVAEQSERDRSRRIWTAKDVQELEKTELGDFEILSGTGSLSLQDRRQPVSIEEWDAFFDPITGSLAKTIDEVKERIFHGGLDADDGVRKEAWPFLLGVFSWYSTTEERKAQLASLRDEYYKLKQAWWERLDGLGGESTEGESWREERNRIEKEKDVHRTDRNIAIFSGDDIPHPDPNSPFSGIGTNVHLEQLKELLLTYNEYNTELGYVQGMSDILAPIYAVVQDDALAFWCFQHFMDRMERNFLKDQSGMRSQLLTLDHLVHFMDPKLYDHLKSVDSTNFFFFFRMLLVWFKREFEWRDVLHLWEVLWTDFLSSSFHLFFALAILEKHRDVILNHLKAFDEVLKYVNELSGTMDLESTLIRAESLFRKFQRMVEAVDKKDSFPLPVASSSSSKAANNNNSIEEQIVTPELRKLLSRNVDVFYVSQAKKKTLSK